MYANGTAPACRPRCTVTGWNECGVIKPLAATPLKAAADTFMNERRSSRFRPSEQLLPLLHVFGFDTAKARTFVCLSPRVTSSR